MLGSPSVFSHFSRIHPIFFKNVSIPGGTRFISNFPSCLPFPPWRHYFKEPLSFCFIFIILCISKKFIFLFDLIYYNIFFKEPLFFLLYIYYITYFKKSLFFFFEKIIYKWFMFLNLVFFTSGNPVFKFFN